MSMFPIASLVGNGTSAVFSFTNIPQTFDHLKIIFNARSSVNGFYVETGFRLNGSGASNYAYHYTSVWGNGTANYGNQTSLGIAYLGSCAGNTALANVYGGGIIEIFNYKSTTNFKTVRGTMGVYDNTNGLCGTGGGLWYDATIAAITQFDLYCSLGNWMSNSRADLYGILDSNVTGA